MAKKKILIAEDEKSYSRALILKLDFLGYEAVNVENGQDALELLKKDKYDLFLLDLIMPKMNGFLVLETLQKEKIKVPVIVLSNLGQADDEKKAKDLGALEFLNKANTTINEVIEKIQNILK